MYNAFTNKNPKKGHAMPQPQHTSYPDAAPTDYGPNPFVVDINKAATNNNTYRTVLWTGDSLQLTLMSIPTGEDIGLEIHANIDQFLRIESGQGIVLMGSSKDDLYIRQYVFNDSAILVPAGTWHNVINTGTAPLKLYSIYAPPHHPWGAVSQTKTDAEAKERNPFR